MVLPKMTLYMVSGYTSMKTMLIFKLFHPSSKNAGDSNEPQWVVGAFDKSGLMGSTVLISLLLHLMLLKAFKKMSVELSTSTKILLVLNLSISMVMHRATLLRVVTWVKLSSEKNMMLSFVGLAFFLVVSP